VEESLDPTRFFRVNRQFLVSSEAIAKMYLLSKSRIKLQLKPDCKEEVLVSSARTHAFREWMDN
jgi:DNA-binding LytR/AlgR family response regulator